MMDEMDYMKLDYETVREAMHKKKDSQVKYFTIIVSILAVVYGIIFQSSLALDLILVLPLLILPFGLRFQYLNEGVEIQSKYLKELEDKIVNKLKEKNDKNTIEWKGFQNFWMKEHRRWKILVYDIGSKWLLFIGVPMLVAVLYCIKKIIENFNIGLYLEVVLYGIVSVSYSILMIVVFYYFVVDYYTKNKGFINLERRYAKGEITKEEYEEIKKTLEDE